jgi:GNAT superfamily N-acetyltransferase
VTQNLERRVRTATSRDRSRVVQILTAAFLDDPVLEHLLPRTMPRREARLRALFDLEVARSMRRRGTWISDDGAGVLVGFPPGKWETTRWEALRSAARWRWILGSNVDVAAATMATMEAEQRTLPDHWFLCYGAVEPGRQKAGTGTALLMTVLAECDRTGTPAYMEASSPVTREAGARYGFVPRPGIPLPGGGPTIHPMWRDPA